MRADDVRAEDLSVFRAADDLDEAFLLARRAGAPIRTEWKLADLVLDLLVLALLLGEADGCDLGVAIRRARHVRVVDRVRVLARDDLRDDVPLALALVREHRRARDVADRVNTLDACLH